jgi:hypothetical protein
MGTVRSTTDTSHTTRTPFVPTGAVTGIGSMPLTIISLTRNTAYSSAIMGGGIIYLISIFSFEPMEPPLFQWNRSRLCGG